jgi:multidrug efflux pump subunit AcrA (membrane-fusion protein)
LPKKNNQDQTPAEERENARVAELEQLIAQKESELALKDLRISELEQAVASRDSQLAELESRLSQAVEAYRALVVKANPAVPAELISGESVEAIDKSLANAQLLVDRVRQELESEIAAAKIPAGAPPRTPPDFSALSPKEKIQYAIGERR